MPVRIYTDSEPLLESIASTRQIERKKLRMSVQELKDSLVEGYVRSYQWIPTKEMWADGLTKEMGMAEVLREMLKTGVCELGKSEVNKVEYEDEEIKRLNIRNRQKNEGD